MTSCAYCANHPDVRCEGCDARVCLDHCEDVRTLAYTNEHVGSCAPPDDGPHQQRGCYKPPVAGVECSACGWAGHLGISCPEQT